MERHKRELSDLECLIMLDGLEDDEVVDAEGDRWKKADEYGDRSQIRCPSL